MSGITEFHNFTRLPAEIRNMIWDFSLPEARVFEVLDAPNAKARTPSQQGLMFANIHHEPPPALSAVCRESRSFVLHHYRPLTFGPTTKYVDLSRDIILLEPYLLVKRLHRTLQFMSKIPLVRENISCLALGTSYGVYTGILHPVLSWKISKNNMGKLLQRLATFPKLRELVFIVHQEFQFEFDFRYAPSHAQAYAFACHHHLPPPPPPMPMPIPIPMPMPENVVVKELDPRFAARYPPMSTGMSRAMNTNLTTATAIAAPPTTTTVVTHPQLVHGAYRFKFDIEANINHNPRRPHVNELLYYPLELDEDDLSQDLDDVDSEWSDPWPTNDDWRRFRRRFQRAINLSLEMGLDAAWGPKKKKTKTITDTDVGQGHRYDQTQQQREVPYAVKGASLLWRYTRGICV